MHNKEVETYCPQSRTDWRQWLQKNHQSKQSVWLVYYTKKSNLPSISWSESVDEALAMIEKAHTANKQFGKMAV